MMPERIGKILVVIVKSASKRSESSNSSIWDKLEFESSRFITVDLSHLGCIKETGNRKSHKKEMQHIRVGK